MRTILTLFWLFRYRRSLFRETPWARQPLCLPLGVSSTISFVLFPCITLCLILTPPITPFPFCSSIIQPVTCQSHLWTGMLIPFLTFSRVWNTVTNDIARAIRRRRHERPSRGCSSHWSQVGKPRTPHISFRQTHRRCKSNVIAHSCSVTELDLQYFNRAESGFIGITAVMASETRMNVGPLVAIYGMLSVSLCRPSFTPHCLPFIIHTTFVPHFNYVPGY